MKVLLTSAPVLQQARDDQPFTLKTDASGYALGAVLEQGDKNNEHPIEFISRLLTSAERNYATIEREALAVVWAVNKFRGYVEGGKIKIITDHQPLKWLMSIKSPSGRLARWALQPQQFDIDIDYTPGRTNVIADGLSRPPCDHDNDTNCHICTISIDLPKIPADNIRNEQLKDDTVKEIIECFERQTNDESFARWTKIGYFMSNGILYRYSYDNDTDDAQLVVPIQNQLSILQAYHDDPTAGHYGIDRTFARIASRYYWPNMRKHITAHISQCIECQRYKTTNLKPAGLIQSTASRQRFEVVAIDLFGPLPATVEGYKQILIVEDVSSRWIELFPVKEATAEICANILLTEVFLRYGIPRRILSDHGTQFISAVVQQLTYCLNISHVLTPVYHPQANPVERKNRDLKTQLAILVGDEHTQWANKLPMIRFAMNTAKCQSTGYSAAFLTFGRELRTSDDVQHDLRAIVYSENFVSEITPKLKLLADTLRQANEATIVTQQRNQKYKDQHTRPDPGYTPGQKVLVTTHRQSNAAKKQTAKFAPRRDGPYIVLQKIGTATYEVALPSNPTTPVGIFHTSALSSYTETSNDEETPMAPIRKRGRPRKNNQ